MCLKYGTPDRFRKVFTEGLIYPEHCKDWETLQTLLREELEQGVYTNPALYHPLLGPMLQGLVSRYEDLPSPLKEPNYPFCDLVQAVALCFCFSNGATFVPTPELQEAFMAIQHPEIRADVYAIFRVILRRCMAEEMVKLWEPRIEWKGGFMAVVIMFGFEGEYLTIHPPK